MKLAVIEWIDTMGGATWVPLDEVDEVFPRIVSVGWIKSRPEKGILLLSTIGENAIAGQSMLIPEGCITSVRFIDKGGSDLQPPFGGAASTDNNRPRKRKGRRKR